MTVMPFTPDSDTAQQLAEAELSKAMYDHSPNLLERIIEWILRRFEVVVQQFADGDGGAGNIAVVVAIGLVVAAIIAFAIRRARASNAASRRVRERLFDDDRTSAELFAAAATAEADGNLNLAVIERFRAVIRLLDERKVIRAVPGMTPLEAARAGAQQLGSEELFAACAQLFNDVYYWHGQASSGDVRMLDELHTVALSATAVPVKAAALNEVTA